MFEILENQRMLEGNVNVTLIPPDLRGDMLTQFLTAEQAATGGRCKVAATADSGQRSTATRDSVQRIVSLPASRCRSTRSMIEDIERIRASAHGRG